MDALEQELMARSVGNGMVRMQPQVHPTIDAGKWRVIEDAMSMLPEHTRDTMPNITVRQQELSPAQWTQVKEAYVDQRQKPGEIVLMSSGRNTYDKAKHKAGALQELAALIAHERQHVVNGPDEHAAYDEQIDTLRRLGAPRNTIQQVLSAKHAVAR